MSIHEWKKVETTSHHLEERLNALEQDGFKIHSVQMEARMVTVNEWYDHDGDGYGSMTPRPYNVWVILATKEAPPPTERTP